MYSMLPLVLLPTQPKLPGRRKSMLDKLARHGRVNLAGRAAGCAQVDRQTWRDAMRLGSSGFACRGRLNHWELHESTRRAARCSVAPQTLEPSVGPATPCPKGNRIRCSYLPCSWVTATWAPRMQAPHAVTQLHGGQPQRSLVRPKGAQPFCRWIRVVFSFAKPTTAAATSCVFFCRKIYIQPSM